MAQTGYAQTLEDEIGLAYIGPGAGIALFGSFLAVLIAMFSAFLAILTWPLRWLWRLGRGRSARARAKVRRVVILGLDGLDPDLVEQYLEEGLLPNLAQLRQEGTYTRLGTTWPPLSPVAWSSFSTGANPGKHNIFDFIVPNNSDYRPRMSSVRIRPPRRTLRLGSYRVPLSRPRIDRLRRSKPFWNVLGEAGVFSAILRVPITFPPDKFYGVQLSAMCVPDLRGTQGMFAFFTEEGEAGLSLDGDVGGEKIVVERRGSTVGSCLPGPENPLRRDGQRSRLALQVKQNAKGKITLHIADQSIELVPYQYTAWVRLAFPLAPGVKVRGLCRFYLQRFEPPFEMYCTPLHIDPDKPVMPISHPSVYATYLAKQQGPYATLGLAEDTWSLSEEKLSEEGFLEQAYDIDRERQKMFFDSLQKVRRGLVTCVFDGPDRIQHMFWRFHDDRHPARGHNTEKIAAHRHTIRDMYVRMDELVGRTRKTVNEDTALVVMSDHGFKPFRRGVDLNAWLLENGYLKLKNDAPTSKLPYLEEVDWTQTRAYAVGLAGIFLNQRGREAEGIVDPGQESGELVDELRSKLTGLFDSEQGEVAIHQAVQREEVYDGPYVDAAPDLIIGYNVGYRVSWDAANGKCGANVFSDNTKAWSGDHCIHPDLVPGVLFSNIALRPKQANIIDLAPTVLDLLGVRKPGYMDGKSLLSMN
ncbi:MAG: alkaline phosphatase family protein [Pirellulales bacterium]|nr:alkaline phosphatase family protein [Pirellulales bacterium]